MPSKINIVIAVDAIGALSDQRLENNLFMMNDGPYEREGAGGSALVTSCAPGQLIKWTIYPIDLQSPASIKSIRFLDSCQLPDGATGPQPENVDAKVWAGYVPTNLIPGKEYRYRLEILMNPGILGVLSVDTPSLKPIG